MSNLTGISQVQSELLLGDHAIVIGASIAGLLVARVVSPYFHRVTLIERDDLPLGAEHRRGVPQDQHLHTLLVKGKQVISQLFPGLIPELIQAGAVQIDLSEDVLWFQEGGYKARFNSGVTTIFMSRPLLELYIRRRVLAIHNLTCLQNCEVTSLIASTDCTQVTGIKIRRRIAAAEEESLDANLVIDATGRGSKAIKWLGELGYPRPEQSIVKVNISYTSRIYRQNYQLLANAKGIFTAPAAPDVKRAGGLFPIEGGRWIVTLAGWLGDKAPPNELGFLAFAKGLANQDIYNVISRAEPLTDFVMHRFPSSLRHHYERMSRFPIGYLVTGDAICSFDPIYGQGMSVSAMEAKALERCLAEISQQNLHTLSQKFFYRAAQAIKNAWMLATCEDFRFPEVEGPKPVGTDLLNWYVSQVHRSTFHDRRITRDFLQVLTLTHAPKTLFQPRVFLQVAKDYWVQRHPSRYLVSQLDQHPDL